MTGKILFSHEGARSEDALDRTRPFVYEGSLLLPDQTNDPAREITNSITIPRDIAQKLRRINGKFSLTEVKAGYKNANVFSRRAKVFDSVNRVCYLRYADGTLQVCEFKGTRGSNYSALYPALAELLRREGFEERADGFAVPDDRVDLLVDLVNEVFRMQEAGELRLEAADEVDTMTFPDGRHYYFKAYWRPAGAGTAPQEAAADAEDIPGQVAQIRACIRRLAGAGLRCAGREQLEEIQQAAEQLKNELDIVCGVCRNGLDSFDRARQLGL